MNLASGGGKHGRSKSWVGEEPRDPSKDDERLLQRSAVQRKLSRDGGRGRYQGTEGPFSPVSALYTRQP